MTEQAATAFCPAHVTGFFKASTGRDHIQANGGAQYACHADARHAEGSTGAGFSLEVGVTTSVSVTRKGQGASLGDNGSSNNGIPYTIDTSGYGTDDTRLSDAVVRMFLQKADSRGACLDAGSMLHISHKISVPVGYGLGCSGAVALSLAYALNDALNMGMSRQEAGAIAHAAEIECKTGLGDVLAAYHGGFEVRTRPGAPGVGAVEVIPTADGMTVFVLCMAPMSTRRFIAERLPFVNGLGGEMIERLRRSKDYEHFEDMSLEFAQHVGVITPRMRDAIRALQSKKVRCGVALFGQTIFCMTETRGAKEAAVQRLLADNYSDYIVIKSGIDRRGARPLL